MKYVKCVFGADTNLITIGKVYEVKAQFSGDSIYIMDDDDYESHYLIKTNHNVWFIDYTDQYREDKINEILS